MKKRLRKKWLKKHGYVATGRKMHLSGKRYDHFFKEEIPNSVKINPNDEKYQRMKLVYDSLTCPGKKLVFVDDEHWYIKID